MVEEAVVLAEELEVELELGVRAFAGGVSTLGEPVGVKSTVVVMAFDPAEADPLAEKDVEDAGPEVPADALA